MAIIRYFRDLRAYPRALQEPGRVFELTKSFPKDENFSPTGRIRRSSRAVQYMIAEAWGNRRYPASFVSKLTDVIGEANETQSWLDEALDCGYISADQQPELHTAWQSIGGMIANRVVKSDDFCRSAK